MRSLAFILVACLAWLPAQAKIYKWIMPDGSIQYSDRPQEEGAKALELPPLQTYSPPPAPATTRGEGEKPAGFEGYDSVKVVSPKPDETLRDNGGTVNVSIALDPPLRPGHLVEIQLDGKPIGSGAATSASVTNVDRGSHTVSAVVKDAEGNTLGSAPAVTFHLKRTSRLIQPARR